MAKKEMTISNKELKKCKIMHSWKILILGILVLANAYWMIVSWDYFIGIILVLAGLWKLK